jgi:BMFP domain-containing protein YqiC
LHDDARLFRQVAARARSGADELEQLIDRLDEEDAAPTSGGE